MLQLLLSQSTTMMGPDSLRPRACRRDESDHNNNCGAQLRTNGGTSGRGMSRVATFNVLTTLSAYLCWSVSTTTNLASAWTRSLSSPTFHHSNTCRDRLVDFPGKATISTTCLRVSELHVPGYATSKLPFLEKDHDAHRGHDIATNTDSQTQQIYTNGDYKSQLPYQNGFLVHATVGNPIFSSEECFSIVQEAERVAKLQDWTRNRHGNFPTTDLPIVELPETLLFFRRALVERIYPLLRNQFGTYLPDPSKLRVADGFVVKYDAAGGQTELKPHRDGSVLSLNIALNPATDFEGGGTWFASLNHALRIDQGEIVTHASGLLHGGHGITRGQRYILVAFVILEDYDSWSMRFYNQVRNL